MSFWGNKLGPTAPPPPPAPGPQYAPGVVPSGIPTDPGAQQRAVNDYVSRLPGHQYAQQQAPAPQAFVQGAQWQPKSAAENPTNVSDVLPIWHWQGNPQGGAKDSATLGNCPHCGSTNYFSRAAGGAVVNTSTGQMVAPTPECFECGYPRQQGALGQAHIEGPAMAARQGEKPSFAPEGSIGTLTR